MGMESVYKLSVILNLVDNLSSQMNGVQSSVSGSVSKLNSAFGTMQKAGAAMAGIGGTITGLAMKTVTATFDTQNALGELSSLGVKDLKAVEDAAKSFSDTWAGTSKADFITASYDIKSGIASLTDEGVAQFTQLAALTGKATKSTTEEMGSLFATGYGIYKGFYDDMSDLEFGEMFSAGIATAVKNYKTSGSEMASAISALGATATNANVTRYEGEHPENFRSRIAMYEEICKLGGTNEGVLLAVRTLGYTSPVLVRANDLTGFSHFTLDGSWLLDGSRTLESDTIENRWAEFYIVIVMDADEEHPISFDIMRKTVRKWKEVGAKDNYFFKYNLSIRQPHTGNFLKVLYKKHLFYYDYRKLDGMWKLDGSYMLDAEMTPVGTRIGYRYESLYELHEAGLAVMAYNYACRMVESAILKAAYSFRMYYFEYLKTDGSWTTDGSYVVDAQMSPREMRWSTTFHHQHEEKLLMKQRYRMQPCEEAYSIRKTLEQYRMVIDYFDYLKLNGLWKLTGSRLMDAQRTEYTTKQAYSFGVEHTREFRVIWHEEHNLIFLDGTWSLDGSKIIDAWQKTEVL